MYGTVYETIFIPETVKTIVFPGEGGTETVITICTKPELNQKLIFEEFGEEGLPPGDGPFDII